MQEFARGRAELVRAVGSRPRPNLSDIDPSERGLELRPVVDEPCVDAPILFPARSRGLLARGDERSREALGESPGGLCAADEADDEADDEDERVATHVPS